LIKLIESRTLVYLKDLDISNNKMGESNAKQLLTEIIDPKKSPFDHYICPIEYLNLSRNGLGFKTGALAMSLLIKVNVK
jgi:hypothetical protein